MWVCVCVGGLPGATQSSCQTSKRTMQGLPMPPLMTRYYAPHPPPFLLLRANPLPPPPWQVGSLPPIRQGGLRQQAKAIQPLCMRFNHCVTPLPPLQYLHMSGPRHACGSQARVSKLVCVLPTWLVSSDMHMQTINFPACHWVVITCFNLCCSRVTRC